MTFLARLLGHSSAGKSRDLTDSAPLCASPTHVSYQIQPTFSFYLCRHQPRGPGSYANDGRQKLRGYNMVLLVIAIAVSSMSCLFCPPQVSLELVRGDLASPFLGRLNGMVDVLLFNPPYVPTESEEIDGNGIEVSWAGGKDGMEVTNRLLPRIKVRWCK